MGMSITGQPLVNRDFQYTYYHLKKNHIARKNSAFAQNPVVFATPDACQLLTVDPRCRNIINTLDVYCPANSSVGSYKHSERDTHLLSVVYLYLN